MFPCIFMQVANYVAAAQCMKLRTHTVAITKEPMFGKKKIIIKKTK